MKYFNAGFFAVIATSFLWTSSSSEACSTFLLGDDEQAIVGKSYDWHAAHGMAIVNKRNVAKTAIVHSPQNQPAKWISQFGSVTFTQFGQELPLGGINEAGLVVEIMWLSDAVFPTISEKPVLNELQWIQFILDTSSNVETAIAQARSVDIVNIYAPVHFIVCDRRAQCASLEYLDGALTIHSGEAKVTNTLTNNTYMESLDFLRQHTGFGGQRSIPTGLDSLDRFVRIASMTKSFAESGAAATDYAFGVLDSVRSTMSRWQIVYEQHHEIVHVKIPQALSDATIRNSIDMSELDFDCATPVMALDMRGDVAQPAWRWHKLNEQLNHRLVEIGNQSIGEAFDESMVSNLASYPQSLRCLN